eukprot:Gb_25151 [translate_table: standard]
MVRVGVLVEIRLVAPIWKHCGILSKVKVVATPSVVIGPITSHMYALSGWTVWRVVCATIGVSSVDTSLGIVGLHIALWSLTALYCLLVSSQFTTHKWIHIIGLLLMHHLLLAVPSLINVPHWLLGSEILKSDFWEVVDNELQYFFEAPTVGREGQEMPLVDISPSLQEGQFLLSPCHWTLEYELNSYLRLLETRHFEGMRPFVSSLRGRVHSPHVYHVLGVNISTWVPWSYAVFYRPSPFPSANKQSFQPLILAFGPAPVLWATSEDPLVAGGLVRNRHQYCSQG